MQETTTVFEQSLEELGVSYTRTNSDGFLTALAEVIEEPAVGVPLGIDDISLAETSVELEVTPNRLAEAQMGVTPVDKAIAEYGSLVIRSTAKGTEPISLYPPSHVGVVRERDILSDVEDATAWLADELASGSESVVFATGVSATGDMGALVHGVHGPETVHVIILEA